MFYGMDFTIQFLNHDENKKQTDDVPGKDHLPAMVTFSGIDHRTKLGKDVIDGADTVHLFV